MESKSHYKLYKKGKIWCAMAIATVALGIGMADNVQTVKAADQTSTSLTTSAGTTTDTSASTSISTTNSTVASSSSVQATNGTESTNAVSTAPTAEQATSSTTQTSSAASDTKTSASSAVNADSSNSSAASTSASAATTSKTVANSAQAESTTDNINTEEIPPLINIAIPVNGYGVDAANMDGAQVFYKDGDLANGYLNDGTNWYFFKNGVKQSDVQKWDGTYYYFDHTTYQRVDNSYMKSNWGDYYLFGNDGKILTDVQQWAGSYYYFDHNTYLRVDNNYVKSNWGDYYLFGNDGRIQTDVQKWAGTYYYFDHSTYLRVDNNYMRSNWGNYYMFGKDGRIISGFENWQNQTYYFNPSSYLKETNMYVTNGNNTYWLDDTGVMRTKTWQIEKAIAIGMSLIGKSPYNWGGGRTTASIAAKSFDCSSFIHYIFSCVGINLGNYTGATTYTEIKLGTGVSWANMRRGDIFFMDNVGHVGMYLGNGLFLHDSPHSSTGGVGINNLSDVNDSPALHGQTWAQIADGVVRRIVS